jgi:aminoglycoside phosphotransferase (APT) family kinase protein
MADPFADALQRLAPLLAGPESRLLTWSRLSGGASQETYAFSFSRGSEPLDLILRRRPGGVEPSQSGSTTLSLADEARVIQAAAAHGAPVPQVVRICNEDDGLGEGYVMLKAPGAASGRLIARGPMFADARRGLARRCGEVLARIHATPKEGLPPLNVVDAIKDLDRYEEIYRRLSAPRPVFELAFRRLKTEAPPAAPLALVHGDYRNGNLLVDPARGLTAVLDWELAHIGDPASDLGWLCVNSWRFGVEALPVGGFGALQDLLDGYRAGGGAPISVERVSYWRMLGSLKWGVMCLMMREAFLSGADPGVEKAMIGRRVSETEIDLVNCLEGR